MAIQIVENDTWTVRCFVVNDETWFKGKDVAGILGHKNKDYALSTHVDIQDKTTLGALRAIASHSAEPSTSNIVYINESGLYSLILSSTKPEAKVFKRWVTHDVLPSRRKAGKYELETIEPLTQSCTNKQISLMNEQDLHYKVVDLIRSKFPDMLIIPGLGELQDTTVKRSVGYKSGYISGQPDLLILNKTKDYECFAIELKTPTGKGLIRDNHRKYCNILSSN